MKTSRLPSVLRLIRLLSYISLTVLALNACDAQPRLKPLAKDAVIVAFGDSLTAGMGANPEQSYPAVLAKMSKRTVINAGISGEVSAEGLQRLPAIIAEYHPQLIIICHGGNDILRKQSMTNAEQNIRAMVKMARDGNIAVVLVAVPAFNVWAESPPFYETIARDFNIPFEPEIIGKLQKKPRLKSDAIHFNDQGYRMMAEAIYQILDDTNAI